MRYIALLVTFLISTALFAQNDNINKFDISGKRHGLWKGTFEETGRPRYEGTFNHGKETGVFKFFDDTKRGPVIATRDFSANDGTSYTTFFDQQGNKVSEGKERGKLREGEWKIYHQGGKGVMSTEHYSNGKLNGVTKVFFPNGKLAEEAEYKNGIKHGIYKKYNEKGTVLEDTQYKDGKLHGQAYFYDKFGNLSSKGVFYNGYMDGYWEWYEDKKLVKKEFMLLPKGVTKE